MNPAFVRRALPALLAAALSAGPSFAATGKVAPAADKPDAVAQAAPATSGDPRLVEHRYNPNEVVTIHGRPNVQAMIAFEQDEHIENVAIGDSNSWQVTPNKRANLLFVKPTSDDAATNMTVVTDRRTYYFDLVARRDAHALYTLHFTYPDEPKDKQPQLAQAASNVEMTAASDPYAIADPARLNFQWASKGEAKLLPAQAYDDGEATFLSWAAGKPIPAILIKDKKGTEGPVNYAVRGDTIVIEGVPREIILRSGDDVATLTNAGPVRESIAKGDAAFALTGRTN
jgi:type IV secretion system protein VirB9